MNRRFESFVKERLGSTAYYAMKEKTKIAALKSWEEYVKRVFVDGEDQDVGSSEATSSNRSLTSCRYSQFNFRDYQTMKLVVSIAGL